MGRTQAGGGSVMLWAMFRSETLGRGIHVDVTLTHTTYLIIVADQVHPLRQRYSLMAVASFSRMMAPATLQKMFQEWFKEHGVDLASKFPRSQSNQASVGCAG